MSEKIPRSVVVYENARFTAFAGFYSRRIRFSDQRSRKSHPDARAFFLRGSAVVRTTRAHL